MNKDIIKEFIDRLLSFEYKSRVDKKMLKNVLKS